MGQPNFNSSMFVMSMFKSASPYLHCISITSCTISPTFFLNLYLLSCVLQWIYPFLNHQFFFISLLFSSFLFFSLLLSSFLQFSLLQFSLLLFSSLLFSSLLFSSTQQFFSIQPFLIIPLTTISTVSSCIWFYSLRMHSRYLRSCHFVQPISVAFGYVLWM